MVGPFECFGASTECQKLNSFSNTNASDMAATKPICTANSYAMCPGDTGGGAKPGAGTPTLNTDEPRPVTFLWVLLAVLAKSTWVP